MALPTFVLQDPPSAQRHMNPTLAALRIGVARRSIDKLTAAGVLPSPLTEGAVENLARRPLLQVASGELTVLRTNSKTPALESDDRPFIGFHLKHSDDDLEATALRWWRSEPERILDNQLFAVTLGTIPVAVYEVLVHSESLPAENRVLRHRYTGVLLARLTPRDTPTYGVMESRTDDVFDIVTPLAGSHPLIDSAAQIMRSRIVVDSGGPIGYLEPKEA